MNNDIFGEDWRNFAPHPVFNEWLPFIGTLIGLISSLIGLAIAMTNYDSMRTKK